MRLFALSLVPLLVGRLVVGVVIGAAATQDSAVGPNDVQRQLDEATILQVADRETALRRFLLLREADGIVEEALAASSPQPRFAPLATPEAKTERAALIGAAAKDFAAFCEGREPQECLLAEAEELMATVPESYDNKWEAIGPSTTGMEIAVVLTTAGQFDDAFRIGKAIGDERERESILTFIAVQLVKDGQTVRAGEARRVAERIEDQTHRAAALGAVERTLSEAEASEVDFAEVEAEARGIEDVGKRILALGRLAGALIEADETEAGEAIAAEGMARDGDRWLMATEGDHWQISGALEGVSRAFRDTGQREAALRYLLHAEAATLAEEDFADRSRQLLSLAEELIRIGTLAEAERVAAGIEDASDRHFATVYLAEALAGAGQFAKAKRIAALIPENEGAKELHALGLAEVSEALAEAGDFAGAEAIADRIPEQDQQRKALATIVKTLVADGQLVEAERITRRVEDGAWRAVALAALASRS